MTDFLDVKRREITKRLGELKPLAEEYHVLEAADKALRKIPAAAKEVSVTAPRPTRGRRKRGRPRGSVNPASKAALATPATPASTSTATPVKAARKKPGRPKGSGKKVGRPPGSGKKVGSPAGKVGRPKGHVGRRKGSGTRARQTLALVQGQPGITIPELAAKMKIKQNYLYRVLPGLEQEGKLEKKGRGWYPKGA
jgi:hypothetical protein